MTLLNIEDLAIHFDTPQGTVQAVNGVDLKINKGEVIALAGESGSGKSVLAKSILGIVDDPGEIVRGDILINDKSIVSMPENELRNIRGDTVSLIFQDPIARLNPTISIGEQIAESIRLHQDVGESVSLPTEIKRKILGASKNSQSWKKAVDMLEAVNIPIPEDRSMDYPHEFSGGMAQRAMIALALASEPDLLIADEPTTALDVTIQAQVMGELSQIVNELNTSVLLIEHNLAVVSEYCDKVNIMYAGEIIEKASSYDLFSNPQHPYTQGLLECLPNTDGKKDELKPIEGSVPDLINMNECCHFAPRCPEADEECYMIDPDHRLFEEGHEVACIKREGLNETTKHE